ncbi:MAG: hypothetical protein CO032_07470 [Nitrosopumilales archaeon CG_4_9_14_0_2_um_filter_34_16]|nr:MAG: hypothetical protein CO032_07470 [Nitrosopumilales archaeon CG_4_9_14_0_2_um_filter_34_16]
MYVTGGTFYLSAYSESGQPMMSQNNMGGMMGMCQSMMNSIPQDVVIKTTSSQVANVGEESTFTLFVTDKKGEPLDNANVILHIEKGGPMEGMDGMNMMDMMGKMFKAENIGSGQYQVKFTPTEKVYYTMHTHAIPQGKSMMSMMNNHMDIGIIAK